MSGKEDPAQPKITFISELKKRNSKKFMKPRIICAHMGGGD